jgi:hypothetical protein
VPTGHFKVSIMIKRASMPWQRETTDRVQLRTWQSMAASWGQTIRSPSLPRMNDFSRELLRSQVLRLHPPEGSVSGFHDETDACVPWLCSPEKVSRDRRKCARPFRVFISRSSNAHDGSHYAHRRRNRKFNALGVTKNQSCGGARLLRHREENPTVGQTKQHWRRIWNCTGSSYSG